MGSLHRNGPNRVALRRPTTSTSPECIRLGEILKVRQLCGNQSSRLTNDTLGHMLGHWIGLAEQKVKQRVGQ